MQDELMSVERGAQYAGGVSKWTIYSWMCKGKLIKTKVGSRTMVRKRDLDAFIERCNPKSPKTDPVDVPEKVMGRTKVKEVNRRPLEVESIKPISEQEPGPGMQVRPSKAPSQQQLFPALAIAKSDSCAAGRPAMQSTDTLSPKKRPTARKAKDRGAEDQKPQDPGSEK